MSTSEKFCQKWNDFQENISSVFGSLREDDDFTDATLACDDGQQVEAHKVILAASSPFFQNLLKRNKHVHPLIYMKGMKSEDLIAIVDFLYYGEANIYQENLDNFLNIAEELKLKGLSEKRKEVKEDNIFPNPDNIDAKKITETFYSNDLVVTQNQFVPVRHMEIQQGYETAVALPKHEFSGDLQVLDEQIKTMMTLGNNLLPTGKARATVCQICGKEGYPTQIRDHIEANHINGILIPCKKCEKTFRSRSALKAHCVRNHI